MTARVRPFRAPRWLLAGAIRYRDIITTGREKGRDGTLAERNVGLPAAASLYPVGMSERSLLFFLGGFEGGKKCEKRKIIYNKDTFPFLVLVFCLEGGEHQRTMCSLKRCRNNSEADVRECRTEKSVK